MIGTSTKVDISGVNVDNLDDKYFSKEAPKKKSKGEGEFFESDKEVSFQSSYSLTFCLVMLIASVG